MTRDAAQHAHASIPGQPAPRWAELARLKNATRLYDAVIEEIDGRRIRIGDRWLTDFASCNYLGFDLDPEIMAAPEEAIRRWGTHPSWSRLLGNPRLYPEIEERLTELIGADDTLVLPTITHIHLSVIPVLADHGTVFCEAQAHRTIFDGCSVAKGQGATLHRWRMDDLDHLREMLRAAPADRPRLVCMDGVNSMSGNPPHLNEIAEVCRAEGALLYVDDAHGFGVIGERRPDETSAYGMRGNSVVRHLGETYDGLILVGGFSKAYSSLLAFIALPADLKELLKFAAAPYLYSGPSPTASLATVLAGFAVNERRGDDIRADLHRKTMRVLDHVRGLRIDCPNKSDFPVIEIPLQRSAELDEVAEVLWKRGIYVTLAAYPLVPRDQAGFRVQVTAANTDGEIDELNAALTELVPVLRTT
ncbi:pyridoxal phosphate-dependent aminotransferase family protein [Actinospica sp. MGRD01-02]|uniref:8-amino-7-oxononanoate synthase n=1 Tax=Actinospica acidithermotolerans TaxID=2828514 RepID=A0A941IPF7_9ACTN|nr:pyridoxal phosphate-dependent aminotransferase family protein [Actinospica acidithermotolerans]MBR7830381.1 pyridoxal phosphate-dependent aminotransferase family protein [Actinospica acidithermotolerans]